MIETVRRLLIFIEREHRAAWVGVVFLALFVSAIEIMAAFLILLVTGLVAGADRTLTLPILGDPLARFPGLTDREVLVLAMAAIAGFFLLRAGIVLTQSYLRARVAERTGVRLSTRLFRGYLLMPYPFHLGRNSAELIRNVNEAVKDVVDYCLIPVLRIASDVLVIVGLSMALILMAPLAALLAAILFLPLMALLFRVVQPRIAALGKTSHEMGKWALRALQQSLHGFRDITVLGRREYFGDQYEKIREEIGRTRYVRQFLGDVPRVALETGLILFVASFIVAATAEGGSTRESLAVVGMFAYAALRILPSLSRVVLQLNELRFGAAAAAEVHHDLALVESALQRRSRRETEDGDKDPLPFRRSIALDDISYRYPDANQDALIEVNVEIKQGESIGVVGPTGGGKSTLLDVILGLLPPTRGRILVDGIDIQSSLASWHGNVGLVSQAIYLLDTTLRRNIALGLDDDAIEEDRIREAIRLAQLEDFVASLPDGLNTVVGERGTRVSGGERQRVAIARALYRRPSVLVLDEGTSALDAATEASFLDVLASADQKRTLIIVAHRLTSVRHCSRLLFVRSGRVVDTGAFEELLARNAAFRRMVQAAPAASAPPDAEDA